MRFQLKRAAAAVVLAGLASACASTHPPAAGAHVALAPPSGPLAPAAEAPSPAPSEPRAADGAAGRHGPEPRFADLAGWAEEDHAAALAAFRQGCLVSREPAFAGVCARVRALAAWDEPHARAFIEDNFRLEPSGASGLLTAYFSPVFDARSGPIGEFTAPVRPRPAEPASAGRSNADRAAIEARPCPDALAWMRPEDLFFLQIQGSGVLVFRDGTRARAVFDSANGAPFVGIAAPMREAGLLADGDTSADAIRAWLADNRGPRAAAVMNLDPRYVFFRLTADDGAEPAGAAGARLIAGRSIAVDPALHPFGEMLWIDATAPAITGAPAVYRRLAVALDTGGAIRGEARADLYMGRGAEAGAAAGQVRHTLRLYRLAPIDRPSS